MSNMLSLKEWIATMQTNILQKEKQTALLTFYSFACPEMVSKRLLSLKPGPTAWEPTGLITADFKGNIKKPNTHMAQW